jgi:hypothetical protein
LTITPGIEDPLFEIAQGDRFVFQGDIYFVDRVAPIDGQDEHAGFQIKAISVAPFSAPKAS